MHFLPPIKSPCPPSMKCFHTDIFSHIQWSSPKRIWY
uniref:Uncharacterized protein n=1 Tax=Anguilla anguilla TaxID=7936 RepID=A0A0E9WFQ2_ANGAN